jgi:hypothetical protein
VFGFFGRFSVDRNGTLTIQNAQQEDQGFYGCTAGNAGGFKRAEFRLAVKGKYSNFHSIAKGYLKKIMFKKNLDWEYQSGDYDGAESIAKTIIITLANVSS